MIKTNSAAVVIPVYKSTLSSSEKISLRQCLRILHDFPIIIVMPENISPGEELEKYSGKVTFLRFDKSCFEDINAYSRLLISKNFYVQFSGFDYILVHQLDAFVFKNELQDWCNKGFDYIGAPWVNNPDWISTQKPGWAWRKNLVGNGGLSLRKVSVFIRMLTIFSLNRMIFERHSRNAPIHEDIFWSFYIPSLNPFFKIPDLKTAAMFSFETSPSTCYKMNNYQLPFGCHAWEKYEPEFWKPIIQKFGYQFE